MLFCSFALVQAHASDNPYLLSPYDKTVTVADDIETAISEGQANIELRLRHEDAKQADRDGHATTLRVRLGYETQQYNLFSAKIEADHVQAADDSRYFDGSNSHTDKALISDPGGTEINQAWLAYDIANTLFKYGRQTLELDNGRFVGKNPLRQKEQSFTGLSVTNKSLNYLTISLARFGSMQTSYGDSHDQGRYDLNTSLAHIQYRGFINNLLSVYYYDLDAEETYDSFDSSTWGIRLSSRIENDTRIEYAFEYARQSDAHDNASDYTADYYQAEFGVTYQGVHILLGREVLGSDDDGFVVTPMGSLSSFQGVTEQLNANGAGNMAGGLQDSYVRFGYECNENFSVIASMHDFESDDSTIGPGQLGKELSLQAKWSLEPYELIAGFGDYEADEFGEDEQRIWLSVEAKF